MYQIFGRSRTDGPLNRHRFVADYLHPDDAHGFSLALEAARTSDGPLNTAVRMNLPGGAQRWIQIDGMFHATSDGSRLTGVVADITERKLLEQRTRDLSRTLVTIQEDERQKIAQELHDSTAQHLVAASLILMKLRGAGPLSEDQNRQWDEAEHCLQEGLQELRSFSCLMHPPALQSARLRATLQQYVQGYSGRSGITVDLRLGAKADTLPYELQRTLLRIVQEGLANIHRHAAATHAAIQVKFIGGRLHLVIKDNGHELGRAPEAEFKFGRGLAGIDARARHHDGRLRIHGGPRGTMLHIVIPLGAAERSTTSVEEAFHGVRRPTFKRNDAPHHLRS
jgi:signal transduction histidine kinase